MSAVRDRIASFGFTSIRRKLVRRTRTAPLGGLAKRPLVTLGGAHASLGTSRRARPVPVEPVVAGYAFCPHPMGELPQTWMHRQTRTLGRTRTRTTRSQHQPRTRPTRMLSVDSVATSQTGPEPTVRGPSSLRSLF